MSENDAAAQKPCFSYLPPEHYDDFVEDLIAARERGIAWARSKHHMAAGMRAATILRACAGLLARSHVRQGVQLPVLTATAWVAFVGERTSESPVGRVALDMALALLTVVERATAVRSLLQFSLQSKNLTVVNSPLPL